MISAPVRQEARTLVRIGLPAIFAQLAQMGMTVIDTIIAGHYSDEALAGIAVGGNLFMLLTIFFMGVFVALNPIAAQFAGGNEGHRVDNAMQSGLWLAALLAPPVILALQGSSLLLEQLGVEAGVQRIAEEYLSALGYGIVPLFGYFVLRSVNEGLYGTRAIMLGTVAILPLNAVLDYGLLYGYWGLPECGPPGVGYATSTVWLVLFLFLLAYTRQTRRYQRLNLLRRLRWPDLGAIGEMLRVGLPVGITITLEVGMFASVGLMVASYSVTEVAAHQISMSIASTAFMLPLGLSIAITARVGQSIGAARPDDAGRATRVGILTGVACSACTTLIMLIWPEWLSSLYTRDLPVIELTASLLMVAALFQMVDGLQVTASGALRGYKDTRIPMWICLLAYWGVGMPTAWMLGKIFELGLHGFWLGMASGLALAAVLLFWRLRGVARRMEQVKPAPTEPDRGLQA